jgi:molybdenum cofactor cytidylyltransferase
LRSDSARKAPGRLAADPAFERAAADPRGVTAIILAAGRSTRAGTTKQLLVLNGKPLVQHAIDAAVASSAEAVLVVLGYHAERVRAYISADRAEIVVNSDYASGQASSLAAGIGAVGSDSGAAIILLGDQPGITPRLVDRVIEVWRETGAPIVIPVYRGVRGNPVLIDQSLFGELQSLTGDAGARAIFSRHAGVIHHLPIAEQVPPDIDTPADYEAAKRAQAK